VTFRVTTEEKSEKSEFPGDGAIRVRIVRAEVSRLDSRGQVVAERGEDVCDSVDSLFDPLGHGRARPLSFGRRPPVPAAESDGSGQLLGYHVHLGTGAGSTVGIVKPRRLLQIVSQLVNPLPVFCLGLSIKNWTAVLAPGGDCMAANFPQAAEQRWRLDVDRCTEQFGDVDISPRTTQQITEVVQTARGFEDCSLPLITNRPVITLWHKHRLFERAQDRATPERFLQTFKQGACEFPGTADVLIKAVDACLPCAIHCYAAQN
jgi:hypothetical protein